MTYRLSEFVSMANQMIRECKAAQPIVEKVRQNPFAFLADGAPASWCTAGMAEQLITAAAGLLEQAPDKSAALAELATIVAARLGAGYPRITRAQFTASAWKELANAYRYRSDYEASLRALDRADRAIEDEPSLGYDAAVLALARATTLRELDRIPEALHLVRDAASVFRAHGDDTRVAQCELLAGMIHHRLAHAADARRSYRRARELARDAGSAQIVASSYVNLAVLDAECGRTGDALDALRQALAVFTELGAEAEIARARWGIGLALLNTSKFDIAIPILRAARETFRHFGMTEEGGLAGIELVEAHLALGQEEPAREVLGAVIDELRAAGLNARALTALAYLHELGPDARRESARHVHVYLERLRRNPALRFQPPQ